MKETNPAERTVPVRRKGIDWVLKPYDLARSNVIILKALMDWQNRHLKKLSKKDTDDAI